MPGQLRVDRRDGPQRGRDPLGDRLAGPLDGIAGDPRPAAQPERGRQLGEQELLLGKQPVHAPAVVVGAGLVELRVQLAQPLLVGMSSGRIQHGSGVGARLRAPRSAAGLDQVEHVGGLPRSREEDGDVVHPLGVQDHARAPPELHLPGRAAPREDAPRAGSRGTPHHGSGGLAEAGRRVTSSRLGPVDEPVQPADQLADLSDRRGPEAVDGPEGGVGPQRLGDVVGDRRLVEQECCLAQVPEQLHPLGVDRARWAPRRTPSAGAGANGPGQAARTGRRSRA